MSKPVLDKSHFVSIGAWNPAIIQPRWIRKEFSDLVPDEKVGMRIMTSGTNALRMEYEKFYLDPSNGRLIIIPRKLDNSTIELIAKFALAIREKLIYTPINASGFNFCFQLEEGEQFTIDDIDQPDKVKELYKGIEKPYEVVSRNFKNTFSVEDYTINFLYEYKGSEKTLQINYEYTQPSDSMQIAAEAYVETFHKVQELIGTLIRKI